MQCECTNLLHGGDTNVPSSDDLSLAENELESCVAVTRRVELGTIGLQYFEIIIRTTS